jgi:hypothetical protein
MGSTGAAHAQQHGKQQGGAQQHLWDLPPGAVATDSEAAEAGEGKLQQQQGSALPLTQDGVMESLTACKDAYKRVSNVPLMHLKVVKEFQHVGGTKEVMWCAIHTHTHKKREREREREGEGEGEGERERQRERENERGHLKVAETRPRGKGFLF